MEEFSTGKPAHATVLISTLGIPVGVSAACIIHGGQIQHDSYLTCNIFCGLGLLTVSHYSFIRQNTIVCNQYMVSSNADHLYIYLLPANANYTIITHRLNLHRDTDAYVRPNIMITYRA